MTQTLPSLVVRGWTEPRGAIRDVIARRPDEAGRLVMVALHAVLSAISLAILLNQMPNSEVARVLTQVPPAVRYLLFGALMFGGYYIASFLLHRIGAGFGGSADVDQSRTIVAWWLFVSSAASAAVSLLALVLPRGIVGIMELVVTIGGVAIFAVYVAEIHGFQSVARVAGATIGVLFMVLLVMNLLTLAVMPR